MEGQNPADVIKVLEENFETLHLRVTNTLAESTERVNQSQETETPREDVRQPEVARDVPQISVSESAITRLCTTVSKVYPQQSLASGTAGGLLHALLREKALAAAAEELDKALISKPSTEVHTPEPLREVVMEDGGNEELLEDGM
jgi:hypothetical protein